MTKPTRDIHRDEMRRAAFNPMRNTLPKNAGKCNGVLLTTPVWSGIPFIAGFSA